MPLNVYAHVDDLKAVLDVTSTTYDELLLAALVRASRLIDNAAGRRFHPLSATRYEDGSGSSELWLSESWLELTTVSLSEDNASTYTALAASDWWASDGKTWDRPPYQFLAMNPNGDYATWYAGARTVKLVGVLGWHRDYGNAWEASGDTVQDGTGLTASITTITVSDADGADARGATPRFSVGCLLKLESEYCEVTSVTAGTTNTLTVVRGVGGTTAATHAKTTAIYRYRPEEAASHAALIHAARLFKRGQQAFADAGANYELGQLNYVKGLDPEAQAILYAAGLRRLTVG